MAENLPAKIKALEKQRQNLRRVRDQFKKPFKNNGNFLLRAPKKFFTGLEDPIIDFSAEFKTIGFPIAIFGVVLGVLGFCVGLIPAAAGVVLSAAKMTGKLAKVAVTSSYTKKGLQKKREKIHKEIGVLRAALREEQVRELVVRNVEAEILSTESAKQATQEEEYIRLSEEFAKKSRDLDFLKYRLEEEGLGDEDSIKTLLYLRDLQGDHPDPKTEDCIQLWQKFKEKAKELRDIRERIEDMECVLENPEIISFARHVLPQ